jgi:hypothetical protein
MGPRRATGAPRTVLHDTISRRRLLAAGGAVAAGSLAGCLNQVASSVTNTGASPAAVFAGTDWNDDDTEVTGSWTLAPESPHVSRLTPSLSGGSGLLSSDVELEGWVTSVALLAANYNNSRSHKSTFRASDEDADSDDDGVGDDARGEDYNTPRSNRSIARPGDIIDDDIDGDDETFRRVSRLDAQLQEATTAAATAISKRSARTGRNPQTEKEITAAVGDMEAVLAEMRAVLERCSDDSCVAALENVDHREADVQRATEHVENGEWEAFGMTGGDDDDILVGDYLLPSSAFDPSGLFSAPEQAALFRYLEQKPVLAERFSVSLPDAEVPGGDRSIRDEVTPERLIAYLTGGDDGGMLSKADSKSRDAGGGGDCDDDDRESHPGALCGTTPHFVAKVSEPRPTGGSLEVVRGEGEPVTVTVVNRPPTAKDKSAKVCGTVGGDRCEPGTWTRATASGSGAGASVYQVLAQPPACPHPFPALLYVQRCRSDDQLVYTGGWVVDDAALYETSMTVLSMAVPTQVVGIECCFDYSADADGDGLGDLVAQAGLNERARRGARIESGTVSALVASGRLSEDGGGNVHCWGSGDSSKAGSDSCREAGGASDEVLVTHCPLDAPVLHLVNAGSASNEVKFKAGAELSKSVN